MGTVFPLVQTMLNSGRIFMTSTCTLSTDGCDWGTAFKMSNKIVRRSDGLYVTWLDCRFRIMVARVDLGSGKSDPPFALAQGIDNHCAAAMTASSDGRLHLVAGSHGRAFIHRWSDTPSDPASWSLPEAVGVCATYPSLVCDSSGTLHLAHRYAPLNAHYGTAITRRPAGGGWTWPLLLVQAPAPGYTFPTNSLALGPDGTLHLLIEFYKMFPNKEAPPHTMAVAHFESADGGVTWRHSDGRTVARVPVGLEDTQPIRYKGGGNLRPSNIAILPDKQPALVICETNSHTLELAVRCADHSWVLSDLTRAATAERPDWKPTEIAQVAVDREGRLAVVGSIAPDGQVAHREAQLFLLRVDPSNGRVGYRALLPKTRPDEPDGHPSVEKNGIGIPGDDLFLLYTSGSRTGGKGNLIQLLQLS